MKFSTLFFSALASAAFASDVVDLSSSADEFNKFIKSKPIVLAKFFAPWCGHCKNSLLSMRLLPPLSSLRILLSPKLTAPSIRISAPRLDQGYPTLLIFRGLDEQNPYNGGRTSKDIVNYMERELLPAWTNVKADNVDKFLDGEDEVSILGLLSLATRSPTLLSLPLPDKCIINSLLVFPLIRPSLTSLKLKLSQLLSLTSRLLTRLLF